MQLVVSAAARNLLQEYSIEQAVAILFPARYRRRNRRL